MNIKVANKSRVGKIFKNFGLLTSSRILGDLFIFILFVVISRRYGQEGIGNYSFAIAWTGFFMLFANFGMTTLSIKIMSACQESVQYYFSRILAIRIQLTIVSYSLLFILSLFLPLEKETIAIIMVIGAYQILFSILEGIGAVFVAHEKMHYPAVLEFSAKCVSASICVVTSLLGGELVYALISLPLVTITHVFIAYAIVKKKYGPFALKVSWDDLRSTLKEALPYALYDLLQQLATRIDVILIGLLLGASAAGIYNVAYRIVFLLLLITYLASLSIFPLASKLYTESLTDLNYFYHDTLRLAILIGLPVAAGIWLIAPPLIDLIFGAEFKESIVVLKLLSVLLFFYTLKNMMATFLIACDRQADVTKSQWTCAWTNVIGNLVLIPMIGIVGAVIATLFSEGLVILLLAIRLKALFGWPKIGTRLMIGCIGIFAFCVPLEMLSPLPLTVLISASVIIYIGMLLVFEDIRENEGQWLRSMIKR